MVAQKINNSKTGVDGGAYICPNGLKIVPTTPQRVTPDISTPVSATAVSGAYYDRFVVTEDINIVSISGVPVSVADFR